MALLSTLRLLLLLLPVDLALLVALAQLAPTLAPWGLAAAWLEAGLRLLALGTVGHLSSPGLPRGTVTVVIVTLGLTPPTFFTLRSLLASPVTTPVALATADASWVTLSYAAATAALLGRVAPGTGTGTRKEAPVRRLLALAWGEWPVLGGAFVSLALAALGEAAGPFCSGKALDAVRRGEGLGAFTIGLVLAADFCSSLFTGCRGGLFLWADARLKLSTRLRLFSRLVRQDLTFFQQTPAAELSSLLANEVPSLCEAVPRSANVALRSLGMVLGVLGFMLGLSPRLTLLALVEVPLVITTRRLYDTRQQMLQRAVLDARARTVAVVQEAVSGMETVRICAGEEEEERRHGQAVDQMLRLKNQMHLEWVLFTFVQRVLRLAVQVLVLCQGHRQLRDGTNTAGDLVTFLLYQARLGQHVQALAFGHGNLLSKAATGSKVLEYLEQEPSGDVGGTLAPPELRGHVTFSHISFAYPTRPEHLVLQDVSFELRPGEVTALVGANGSGKSSCAALLQRFFQPQSGEVLLDQLPLQDYEHRYLHRKVVLVSQEPVLFSGTILENITLGLEGCGEREVRAAAAAAGALPFISALERGFETEVGERGGQLSAGEKQLVAVARALLRRPSVLVLDEATSALDGEGKDWLQKWLRDGGVGTVLLITHCPRMLEAADRVLVLEGGLVVESGTPAELRRCQGVYGALPRRGNPPGARRPEAKGMGGGERGAGDAEGAAPGGTSLGVK